MSWVTCMTSTYLPTSSCLQPRMRLVHVQDVFRRSCSRMTRMKVKVKMTGCGALVREILDPGSSGLRVFSTNGGCTPTPGWRVIG